ncbi:hypothetical protein [Heyndrickxia ginsengihumi]|uniref:hypothetical protein n=1 Tax=Heyndrickxia ginsengihumi TaxID=363870 RepID=UPI0004729FD7|nr:hypothetical protein [Heyndrickxia ginsengihumi]
MIYKVIAKKNLNAHPHTWTKGLDYQVVEKDGYIILASNEGSINYVNAIKEHVFKEFEIQN